MSKLQELNNIEKTIENLSAKKFNYITGEKYIIKYGPVKKMTLGELVKFKKTLNIEFNSSEEIEKELGISNLLIETDKTFLGFTKKEWEKDIMTRVNEIKNSMSLAKNKELKDLISTTLTEEDLETIINNKIDNLKKEINKLA